MFSTRKFMALALLVALLALAVGCSDVKKPTEPEPEFPKIPPAYQQALDLMDELKYAEAARQFDHVAQQFPGTVHAHQARVFQTLMDYVSLEIQNERMAEYREDVASWEKSIEIDRSAIDGNRAFLERHKDLKLDQASIRDRETILNHQEALRVGPGKLAERLERETPRVKLMGERLESERQAIMAAFRTHLEASLQSYDPSAANIYPYVRPSSSSGRGLYFHDFEPFFRNEEGGQQWEARWQQYAPQMFEERMYERAWQYVHPATKIERPTLFQYRRFFSEMAAALDEGDPLKALVQVKALETKDQNE